MINQLKFQITVLAAFSLAFAASVSAQASPAVSGMGGEKPAQTPELVVSNSSATPQSLLDQTSSDLNKDRIALEDKGVTFAGIYTGEVFGNPVGGVKQGVIAEGLLELDLTLDFKKMAGWDGSFHASSYYPMGSGLSSGYTHDLFGVSNIAAYNTLLLFELWYEQKAFDDKVSVRIGQMGSDSEFFISTAAASFLNTTYGWPDILASTVPAANYPYAAPGIRLRVDPDEHWSLLTAVFAGNPAPDRIGDPNPNRRPDGQFDNTGTEFYINSGQGVLGMNELWYKLNKEKGARGLPGIYKMGGWFHTDTFSDKRYDDHGIPLSSPLSDGHPRAVDGNFGLYLIADQAVWQGKSDEKQPMEIDLFFRVGNAEADRSVFDYYCDGGVTFTGFIPGRPNDLFGLATAYGNISDGLLGYVEGGVGFSGPTQPPADFEENIELTYLAKITPWWSVQPDLQVIFHPGGSAAIPNALVLGCRMVLTF